MDSILFETDWILVEIDGAELIDTGERSRVTLRFSAKPSLVETDTVRADAVDCAVAGNAGCNRFRGSCRVTEDALVFGPLAVTRMLCPPPQMDIERQFLAALAGRTQWAVLDDSLILATGVAALRLRAARATGAF